LQKSENAALGHEMPFADGHEPTRAKLSEARTFADATKRCTARNLYHIALVIATDAANIIFDLTHNSEDDLATSFPGVERRWQRWYLRQFSWRYDAVSGCGLKDPSMNVGTVPGQNVKVRRYKLERPTAFPGYMSLRKAVGFIS
jgi:hypothetical protein